MRTKTKKYAIIDDHTNDDRQFILWKGSDSCYNEILYIAIREDDDMDEVPIDEFPIHANVVIPAEELKEALEELEFIHEVVVNKSPVLKKKKEKK